MTLDQLLILITVAQQKNLTPAQNLVLGAAWHGQTYTHIAQKSIYETDYLKTTASRLWKMISRLLNVPITKSTFRSVVETYILTPEQMAVISMFQLQQLPSFVLKETQPQGNLTRSASGYFTEIPNLVISGQQPATNSTHILEYPSGPVPLESIFYIERPPIETTAYQEITKAGSILRIKSAKQMGKSSLLLRIFVQAKFLGYETVSIDFCQADAGIISNLDKLLRWFCRLVSQKLNIPANLEKCWPSTMGSKVDCTLYWEQHILSKINRPLVIAFNEFNLLFKYPCIAQEFLTILRSWSEEAQKSAPWSYLRFVLLYSQEIYPEYSLYTAALNIGLPLTLTDFTPEQVHQLAQRHGLNCNSTEIEQLMAMVGGHPALIRLALYHLVNPLNAQAEPMSWQQLLASMANPLGIYRDHFHNLRQYFQENAALYRAFQQLLNEEKPITFHPELAAYLESLGVVKIAENFQVHVRGELYRLYFQHQQRIELEEAGEKLTTQGTTKQVISCPNRWQQLEQEYPHQKECHRDLVTDLANQMGFYQYISSYWPELIEHELPISVIVGSLDYFDIYYQRYGKNIRDSALRNIANLLRQVFDYPGKIIACFDLETFVIFLPNVSAAKAIELAEKVRDQVKALGLVHDHAWMGGLPDTVTMSLGVTSMQTNTQIYPDDLIRSASLALEKSKKQGGDRTYFEPI